MGMIVFISIAILFLPLCPVKADFLIPYQLDGKIGYVDENLTVRIPAVWDYGSYLRNGEIALVRIDSDILKPQYGLIDTEGTFLVPLGDHRIIDGEGGEYYGGEDGYYLIVDYSSGLQGYWKHGGRFSVLTEKQRKTYTEPGDATWREQQEQLETAGSIM